MRTVEGKVTPSQQRAFRKTTLGRFGGLACSFLLRFFLFCFVLQDDAPHIQAKLQSADAGVDLSAKATDARMK